MGCACSKDRELALVSYKTPETAFIRSVTSHASHVGISTLTISQKPPDVYIGTLEEKIRLRKLTYRANDYLLMLQDLRTQFFQYLDQRTILQDDRGRPVSPRYRKAIDWKLYETFEKEFAEELYRRRHEKITREELIGIFEMYIQRARVTVRPEHLQTSEADDRSRYVSNILIIPPNARTPTFTSETYITTGLHTNRDNRDDSNSSSSSDESTKNYDSKDNGASGKRSGSSRSSSSSRTDSKASVRSNDSGKSSSGSHSSSSNDVTADKDKRILPIPEPVKEVDFEALINLERKKIVDKGISLDEHILLIVLYNQALEELRNRTNKNDRETIVRNLENDFEEKRKILNEKIDELKRKHEEETRVPDTDGYSRDVDKKLRDNESKLTNTILVGGMYDKGTQTITKDTETGDDHDKLEEFINQQTTLIQKLEEERIDEIKKLEEEIAEAKSEKGDTDLPESDGEEKEKAIEKEEEKTVAKKVKKLYKKLEKAVMEDTSDKKKIKKKLKNVRKKLRQTMEQCDEARLKRMGLLEKDQHSQEIKLEEIGHIEDTDDYCNTAQKELLKYDDVIHDRIRRLQVYADKDFTKYEEERANIVTDYVHKQKELMHQIEEDRKQMIDQTERKLLNNRVDDLKEEFMNDIIQNVLDNERIKHVIQKHREQHKNLAKERDAERLQPRKRLRQRLEKFRQKDGRSADFGSGTDFRDLIPATDDYGDDIEYELTQEANKLLEKLDQIGENGGDEQRRSLLEEYLNNLADKFRRLDSDRQDIVNDIETNVTPDSLLIEDMNREAVEDMMDNVNIYDEESVRQKLEAYRLQQKKFLEDLDSDRIQRRGLLAQKLLHRKNKQNEDEKIPAVVPDTNEYCSILDQELQKDEEELLDFLSTDNAVETTEGRQNDIAKRLEDHIGRQKEIVEKLESERREKVKEAVQEPSTDIPSELNVINSWFKNKFFDGSGNDESTFKDKLEEYRKRQKQLIEAVDSSRLQHKKQLQEKLQKLRQEKQSQSNEDTGMNTDDLVKDIATMAGTSEDLDEEDVALIKDVYKQREQNEISDEELQKRLTEHFSRTRRMKELLDEENKSSSDKIKERMEAIKQKRKEDEEKRCLQEEEEKRRLEEEEEKRRIQEEENKQQEEANEEEKRRALSRAYRNNEMVKTGSLIRKHQAENARMAIVVEEGKMKAKEAIKEKKKKKNVHFDGELGNL